MSNVASAVSFLREPAVASAPLTKRIQFLEAKGLAQNEIEEAMRSVGDLQRFPVSSGPVLPQRNYNVGYGAHERRAADWRDYFIMTVVGGGVAYVLSALARKYVLPALQPPTQAEHQMVQDALTAKYDEAAALLVQLKQDTEAMKLSMESQQTSVDGAVDLVKTAVEEFKTRDEQRSEEIKACKEEVDSIREMLPRMMDKNKDAHKATLVELQNELKSLKSLLVSQRRQEENSTGINGTSSPFPANRFGSNSGFNTPSQVGKLPGLPSWQLASSSSSNDLNGNKTEVNGTADDSKNAAEVST